MHRNLERVLHDKRISKKMFAEILGVSENTVQNKVTGKTEFTFSEVRKTCSILFPEYDAMWLFTSEQEDAS